jgi:hypothetical protein
MALLPNFVLGLIAVAMADEGVPLRSIARVTRIPSSDLRERLRDAKDIGDLIALPSLDDWPPGFPRDQRANAGVAPGNEEEARSRSRRAAHFSVCLPSKRSCCRGC